MYTLTLYQWRFYMGKTQFLQNKNKQFINIYIYKKTKNYLIWTVAFFLIYLSIFAIPIYNTFR